VIREPTAVGLGLLAIAAAAGAAWQAGMAWPLCCDRPWVRLGALVAVALAMAGFSLGYWEVLSGLALVVFGFDPRAIRVLFDAAVLGTPMAIAGLLIGVLAMLTSAGVPSAAVGPAMVAGFGIGWILNPYATMGSSRLAPLRQQYVAPLAVGATEAQHPQRNRFWSSAGDWGGGNDGGDGEGAGGLAVILLVIALAVLALAGGVITGVLVFTAARKKAEQALHARAARA